MRRYVFIVLALLAAPLANAAAVPLDSLDGWQVLAYRKIAPNAVSAGEGGLRIAVDRSASPLVYPLPKPVRVSRVRVRARWSGALLLPAGAVQGERGADDAVLKLGLVSAGEQTLNWLQRRIAADWVRTLFDLAPPGRGIGGIHFLSTTQQAEQVGVSRVHPLNKLLRETRLVHLAEPGAFELDVTLPAPAEIVALWVSSDGDDTGSQLVLTIEDIDLLP